MIKLYNIDIPIRTVSEYSKRWDYTPHKPTHQAYKQNPKAVNKWMVERYTEILAKSKKEKAEIHWGYETGLCNDCQHG